jgi:hypothetical protein
MPKEGKKYFLGRIFSRKESQYLIEGTAQGTLYCIGLSPSVGAFAQLELELPYSELSLFSVLWG